MRQIFYLLQQRMLLSSHGHLNNFFNGFNRICALKPKYLFDQTVFCLLQFVETWKVAPLIH